MPFQPKFKPTKRQARPTAVLPSTKEKRLEDELRELNQSYNTLVDAYNELVDYIKTNGI